MRGGSGRAGDLETWGVGEGGKEKNRALKNQSPVCEKAV